MTQPRTPSRWFEVPPARTGRLAFMLHRLSGIGLVIYLYLHLAVLNLLREGAGAWDRFIALVSSPFFLLLDWVLLFGALLHGFNGLRLTLVGFGRGLTWQRHLFWVAFGLSVLLSGAGLWLLGSKVR